MKNIKKLFLILLIFAFLMLNFTVLADVSLYDSSKPFFEIASVKVEENEEFVVDINIGNNPGFWAAKFSLACDDELSFVQSDNQPVFTATNLPDVTYTTNFSDNIFTCLINSDTSSNITYNGKLLTLTFKVNESASIGDYNIYFINNSSSNFINYDGEKVAFTFNNGVVSFGEGYVFEAYNCSSNCSGGTISTYSQTDLTPNGTLSYFKPTSVGDYVTYTLNNIDVGTYSLRLYTRDYPSRGTFDIYVNDVLLKSESFVADFGMYWHEVGEFTISSSQDVTIKFSTNVVGSLYLKTFELAKTSNNVAQTKFNVYIDDDFVDSLEMGNTYKLPNNDDNVVAYKDENGNYYACGQALEINDDLHLSSVKLSLGTLSKASMRLNPPEVINNISGIRFYTEVDEELIATLKDKGFSVELGTLIAPKVYFDKRPTTDLKFGVDFGKSVNYVVVPFESDAYFVDGDFTGIVGSIRNIKLNHANYDFVGRGYVKISFNGVEKIIYATGKDALPKRSICYIAYRLKNDNDVYESYSDKQKEMIDYYYRLYVRHTDDPFGNDIFG